VDTGQTDPRAPSHGSKPGEAGLRLTERRNPGTASLDLATPRDLVRAIAAEDATVPGAVAAAEDQITDALTLVEAAFRAGGRLIYVGAGTSGRLGVLDAVECPPTFGTPPGMVAGIIAGGTPALIRAVEGAEDDPAQGRDAMDEHAVGNSDVVIGIAASGMTPFVRGALTRAFERSSRTVFLTCSDPSSEMRETCDVCIVIRTGPEVVTGSTRMKAGTATKMVLNTLTTGAMIRIGKTYGNLMVDLVATNAKLADRGERIVMEVGGVNRARARRAIAEAGGSVRTAIVIARTGVDRKEAERQLASHDNRLRAIIGDPPAVPTYD